MSKNVFGVETPDSPRVKAGENGNAREYQDKKGKTTPAPNTTLADGLTPKYAQDGCTIEWSENPKGTNRAKR